ncbi:hypothetical protein AAGS61_03165 [Lysinibacillus sp. KU-BSD001]|uniref:hypothetical protein n=1 Tax=Lysinibacillus sp. KU-BSD001 TaxID=3141328 RepID=UPI0036E846F9
MEGLIIMIIIGIVSSLLSKNKEQPEQKPTKAMPPFSQQKPPRENTQRRSHTSERPKVKSLEDFANEIFGQLNEKAEQKQVTHEPIVEQVKPVVQEVVRETRKSTRPELGASRPIVQQAKKESLVVVPQTKEQLMQAIITSEILALPKAKQRK